MNATKIREEEFTESELEEVKALQRKMTIQGFVDQINSIDSSTRKIIEYIGYGPTDTRSIENNSLLCHMLPVLENQREIIEKRWEKYIS